MRIPCAARDSSNASENDGASDNSAAVEMQHMNREEEESKLQALKKSSVFEFTDKLMEKLGTPAMLLQELKMAKRDILTLKNQLEVKEKCVANYRNEAFKLR